MTTTPVRLATRAEKALADTAMRVAVTSTTRHLAASRDHALAGLANADALRDEAHRIRRSAIDHLDELLAMWQDHATANGIVVHRATTAADATRIVVELANRVQRQTGRPARVCKGKSMASEEIHLNAALETAGHAVVETDLGEFIIQLAGETPSHLIIPAIHKTRFDVADLFSTDAGHDVRPEVEVEASYARERLRQVFLEADIGITGVNFAVAETGSIALVENEGNGRMCTTLPKVHVAIMGMERIVETWDDLDVMLALLARSATGQDLTVYNNIISGPREPTSESDGPDEVHVVVVDNGRSAIVGGPFDDALLCIRCGACLNVCPVYRTIGGHAYDSVYSGPIGAVLTPLLDPTDPASTELPDASSLCGACTDVCPVRIPLHDLLLSERGEFNPTNAGRATRVGFALWSRVWSTPATYSASIMVGRVAIRAARRWPRLTAHAPGWTGAWRRGRALPETRR